MSVELAVVAVGARTPVGLAAESSAAAVRARISRLREYPFIAPTGELVVVGADAGLDLKLEGRERLPPLALGAMREVADKLGSAALRTVTRLSLVLPAARPGFGEADAAWVVDELASRLQSAGIALAIEIAGRGHAGVIAAIDRIMQASTPHDSSLNLIVGVDSYLHPDTLMWLEHERMLAGPDARGGFVPGEAAGCLALAAPSLRRRLCLPALTRLTSVGVARESRLRDSPTGSLGLGMTTAVEAALASVADDAAVDAVYTDLNGERYRSEEWGFVSMRIGGALGGCDYTAHTDCWGDIGAATGALATVVAAQSWRRGYARGPRALVATGSFDGLRGAMLLSSPVDPRNRERPE